MNGLLLLAAALAEPPRALPGGAVIQEAGPRITCTLPWCIGELYIDAPPQVIQATLLDFDRYPTLFPRVRSAERLAPDVIHITLEMPFPLQDRDYVIATTANGDEIALAPVAHPLVEDVVRLDAFAGRWTFLAAGEGTEVRYVWHTSLGADIPSWAIERAWRTQGNEILGRLKRSVESASSE